MTNSLEFKSKFKTLFDAEKKRLLFNGRVEGGQYAIASDDMMDEMDFSSIEIENQMRMRLRNREVLYLKKIEEALERIGAGTFGLCGTCEEDIELKRLEARPTTTLCVSCKETEERSEKLHIDGHQHKSLGRAVKFA
ncbi:MAG: TraR/DksA family transcriptional regulator [Cryobacterium sp.]|nr:TraR/DksA family transcriptional regulator [Oligoflexia bacterium]